MKNFLLGVVILFTLSNCGKEKCEFNECGMKAPDSEIQSLQSYLQSNSITATQHCSGIFYTLQQQGTGTRPTACGNVSVYYKGMLTNGNIFDQTSPNQPAVFNLNGLIPGFKIGMLQLKSGGKMTLYIPPSLGYGAANDPTIPANSVLIFEIELLDAN
ncbi:MAG TPA: FKBP-type peptidyl-prolyl cis-trans isomerase [Flavisolibacter sp.]